MRHLQTQQTLAAHANDEPLLKTRRLRERVVGLEVGVRYDFEGAFSSVVQLSGWAGTAGVHGEERDLVPWLKPWGAGSQCMSAWSWERRWASAIAVRTKSWIMLMHVASVCVKVRRFQAVIGQWPEGLRHVFTKNGMSLVDSFF